MKITPKKTAPRWLQLTAAIIGNALEWLLRCSQADARRADATASTGRRTDSRTTGQHSWMRGDQARVHRQIPPPAY